MASISTPTDSDLSHSSGHHVAHHFESAQQEFDAGKLGMWLFLVTEVLFFSGLFVAYGVYRANHPEVFLEAHKYLNTTLGALNTIVLLLSSLTMAWGVRSAQLGDNKTLTIMLGVTLTCASFFLGVKAVEYAHKWDDGLLWAGAYSAGEHATEDAHAQEGGNTLLILSIPAALIGVVSVGVIPLARYTSISITHGLWIGVLASVFAYFAGTGMGIVVENYSHGNHGEESTSATSESITDSQPSEQLTGVFFSIYYAMTGVHAIHILVGMGVIAWLLRRAIRQEFGPDYFGPVDYVGLYWHLVDLVWIYLFPLLYLIR